MNASINSAVCGAQGRRYLMATIYPNTPKQLLRNVQKLDIRGRHLRRRDDRFDGRRNHADIPRMRAKLPPSIRARSCSLGMALAIFMRSRSKSEPGHSLPMRIFFGPRRA